MTWRKNSSVLLMNAGLRRKKMLTDGFKVVDSRANGVYRIEAYSYALDGRGQTSEVIEIYTENGITKISAR